MVNRTLLILETVFHVGVVGLDVGLMATHRGTLSICPDQLRGWVYGQFIIHFWSGLMSADKAFRRPLPFRELAESLCLVLCFLWLLYGLFIGYKTKGCASAYPDLYSTLMVGIGVLGFKTSRDCKRQSSRPPPPLLSVPIIPQPVLFYTVKETTLNNKCSFCMEEFKRDDKIVSLPCKHVFHPRVIQTWLNSHHTCPLCRKRVEVR